jgi:hypothetical protein
MFRFALRRCDLARSGRSRSLRRVLGAFSLLFGMASLCVSGEPLPENPFALDGRSACGPQSLQFLCSYFSRDHSYASVVEACPPGPGGVDMAALKRGAEKLGLHAVGFKASWRDLNDVQLPAVLHVSRNAVEAASGHFVVVYSRNHSTGEYMVFDPPGALASVDEHWLKRHYSGVGMVVSTTSIGEFRTNNSQGYRLPLVVMLSLIVVVALDLVYRRALKQLPRTHKLVLILCGVTASAGGCSENTAKSGGNASVGQRDIDLGRVSQGAILRFTLPVTNETESPFYLTGVVKSCSCQSVKFDAKSPVQAGQATIVEVHVTTADVEGLIAKEIVVQTDSQYSNYRAIPFVLRAEVMAEVKAVPTKIVFTNLGPGEGANRSIQIVSTVPGLTETFLHARSSNRDVTIELRERRNQLLVFDCRLSQDAPAGDLFGHLDFAFSHDGGRELSVDILGRVVGDLHATPSRISVPVTSPDGKRSWKLRITSRSSSPFRVIGIEATAGFDARITSPDAPSAEFEIQVALNDGALPKSGVVTVQTDRARQQNFRVPITVVGQ